MCTWDFWVLLFGLLKNKQELKHLSLRDFGSFCCYNDAEMFLNVFPSTQQNAEDAVIQTQLNIITYL